MGKRKREGGFAFPVFHPSMKVGNRDAAGNAQEMDMVWHDHVAGHEPILGVAPGVEQTVHGSGMVEHALAAGSIDGDEQYNWAVVGISAHGVARGALAGRKRGVV